MVVVVVDVGRVLLMKKRFLLFSLNFNLLVTAGFVAGGAVVLAGGGCRAAGGARIPEEPPAPPLVALPNGLNKR